MILNGRTITMDTHLMVDGNTYHAPDFEVYCDGERVERCVKCRLGLNGYCEVHVMPLIINQRGNCATRRIRGHVELKLRGRKE